MRGSRVWKCATPLVLVIVIVGEVATSQPLPEFSVPISQSRIWAMAPQADQSTLFGGDFLNSVAGYPCENLGRLNSDGTFDLTFHPKGAGIVTALAVQADGKILVSGNLTNLAGQICTNLARLNPNGTPDSSFTSPNPDSVVWAFCVQPDGKILLAGDFKVLAGATNQFIARLDGDGLLDAAFKPKVDGQPIALALQADGKILVGGYFSHLNGQPRNGLGRLNLDGSLDDSFKPAVGGQPWAMALESDGRVLVSFGRPVSGSTNAFTIRLNSDGSLDTNFIAALHVPVNSFGLQADGKVLALYNEGLVRLNADGSLDPEFNTYTNIGDYSSVLRSEGFIVFGAYRSIEGRTNTQGAVSTLTYENGIATWLLMGASPDVATATFEYTTNGTDWVDLGEGTRTTNGWQLSPVTVPSASTLRARGGVTGAFFNGSFWFAQASFGKPVVSLQPVSLTNYVGTVNRLNVEAPGSAPLFYQWYKDGSIVPGATNSALNFAALREQEAGAYDVVVSNQFGMVRSLQASVVALPLPQISVEAGNSGGTNHQFVISVSGQPGETVVVEWSGNLLNWVPLQTNVLSSAAFSFTYATPPKYPRQFYRVRVPLE